MATLMVTGVPTTTMRVMVCTFSSRIQLKPSLMAWQPRSVTPPAGGGTRQAHIDQIRLALRARPAAHTRFHAKTRINGHAQRVGGHLCRAQHHRRYIARLCRRIQGPGRHLLEPSTG